MPKDDYRDKIRAEALRRGIKTLMHFTQVSNLPGIVANGLLSRSALIEARADASVSARYRLDEADGAVSLSVSAINHRMFMGKRHKAGSSDWVVLLIDPSVLWTHPCRFLSENAARTTMKDASGFRGGPWAFAEMFSTAMAPPRFKGREYRSETGIHDCLTTCPDAEVQVFERIAPEAIFHAWTDKRPAAEVVDKELARIADGQSRDVTLGPFAPRFSNGFADWG